MVKPGCSNFKVITANFSDVWIFRIFTVTTQQCGWLAACCIYRKYPTISDPPKHCCNHPKNWTMWICCRVMYPNNADGTVNSADPGSGSTLFGQTCLSENLGTLQYHPDLPMKLCPLGCCKSQCPLGCCKSQYLTLLTAYRVYFWSAFSETYSNRPLHFKLQIAKF